MGVVRDFHPASEGAMASPSVILDGCRDHARNAVWGCCVERFRR